MMKLVQFGLFVCLVCVGVASLVASGEPPELAYGELGVLTPFEEDEYTFDDYKVAACQGDNLKIRWQVSSGDSQRLLAMPPQNVEPVLEATMITRAGEMQVVLKDSALISLIVKGDRYDHQRDVQVNTIPEAICKGFPLELRGSYEGRLEQSTPHAASLLHALTIRWETNDDQLHATLVRFPNSSTSSQATVTFEMTCTALEQEDKLTCVYDPPGAAILTLEGTITPTGYEGNYQGVIETTTLQVPTTGTFSFVKE